MNPPQDDASSDAVRARDLDQLIRNARAGSSEAVGRLVESCRPYLMLVANREMDPAIRTKLGASDIVQETLLTVQDCMDRFEGTNENELLAWMRGILVNDLRENRRKFRASKKRQVDREVSLAGVRSIGRTWTSRLTIALHGRKLLVNEEINALKAALERLPDHYRKVVQLRNWQQLSFEEIALQMDRSAEAVRKLWSRAVERLQQELESNGRDQA